jgi:hypothetical protein
MSEGNLLYLILICVAFVGFAGGLFWGMVATSPPDIGAHAKTEDQPTHAPSGPGAAPPRAAPGSPAYRSS